MGKHSLDGKVLPHHRRLSSIFLRNIAHDSQVRGGLWWFFQNHDLQTPGLVMKIKLLMITGDSAWLWDQAAMLISTPSCSALPRGFRGQIDLRVQGSRSFRQCRGFSRIKPPPRGAGASHCSITPPIRIGSRHTIEPTWRFPQPLMRAT